MSGPGETQVNLLLFSVGGVHFGTDADQVSEVRAYCGEQEEDLFWFHQELVCCDESVLYASPTIITIRTGDRRPYRVIIDSMEEVDAFGYGAIRLFPALVEPFALRCGMWGVLPRNGDMVLLVDFQRLLKEKRFAGGLPRH